MKRFDSVLIACAAISLIAAGCGGGSGPTSPGANLAQIENDSFQLVNEERVVNAISPRLGGDSELASIARGHSERMRDEGFFSHTSPSGETLGQRLKRNGYSFSFVGENLARVTNVGDPAGFAHSLLMQNPAHRGNILSTRFTRLGVGVAFDRSTVWITQIYVTR